ncbi:hypothetical protein FDJ28_gp63 [Pseudomonas phage Bjorn]|uniref:Uncharacterized protein n=1 Tax=Pseudomonas phage Bjorn TaxID=2079288 RepID=A0A2K9VHM4_9CAUD|nr:hypothetical protein FDJ28_gp63 [Pseudomonas phage Bjorn]AUV61809.1 hypothetical protein PsPhBjorn_gp07 [Pseudomonas phage Bjorn]
MITLIVVSVVLCGWALFPVIHPIVKAHIAATVVRYGR